MAGTTRSQEIFNTREEVVSSDLMRMQALISRDAQNEASGLSRSFDCSSGVNPTTAAHMLSAQGTPIYGLEQVPTIGSPSGYQLTVGAGSGYFYSTTGVTADYSSYQVVRWTTQAVTFTNPNGALPRIDIVYAQLGSVATDSAVRNILVDPNARTVAAQAVNKTSNPTATLGVAAGTPASSPVPPALAADRLPLFYVYVPAAAASAANFASCRASWRRAPYPFSAMSGVISGMGLKWDLSADPAAASAGMIAKGFHRIVIDGEVMEFVANLDSTAGGVVQDSVNNPFGSAAAATWNRPYYIYAVGGRHNPFPSYNSSDGILSPVTLVESLSPPIVATGKPSVALTTAAGVVTEGAVYVGLGFVVRNTTFRLGCIMTEDMTYFPVVGSTTNRTRIAAKVGAGAELLGAPSSKPSISTRAAVTLNVTTGASRSAIAVVPSNEAGAISPSWSAASVTNGFICCTSEVAPGSLLPGMASGEVRWQAGGGGEMYAVGGSAGDDVSLYYNGYNHRVGRFGVHVNP